MGPPLGNLLGGYRFPRRVSDQAFPRMRGFQKRHFSFKKVGHEKSTFSQVFGTVPPMKAWEKYAAFCGGLVIGSLIFLPISGDLWWLWVTAFGAAGFCFAFSRWRKLKHESEEQK